MEGASFSLRRVAIGFVRSTSLQDQIPPRDFAIPAVVLYELEVGTNTSSAARRNALDAMVRVCRILPFDEYAARRAASIRLALPKGMQIGPLDTLIAATAMANGAILVTHNTSGFSRVPGLLIEDWH